MGTQKPSRPQRVKFHYDTMKVMYPDALMMKTDTDSLLYYVHTEDLYQDFKESDTIQKQVEFSNYPKNHFLYNCDRKKVAGLFQDECVDGKMMVISEYVGLRAKSYANKLFMVEEKDYECKKKSKGIAKKHLKKRITFEDYKECLFDNKKISLGKEDDIDLRKDKIYSFISHNLVTYSIEQGKIALSSEDDKRILLGDRVHTLALGHYKTR